MGSAALCPETLLETLKTNADMSHEGESGLQYHWTAPLKHGSIETKKTDMHWNLLKQAAAQKAN